MDGQSNVKTLSKVDDRADIIYQKDTSFSAVLDTRRDINDNQTETVRFLLTTSKLNYEQKTAPQNESLKLSTEDFHLNEPLCARSCGTGICVLEASESEEIADTSQRCQCVLGKTGVNCQAGKFNFFFFFLSICII